MGRLRSNIYIVCKNTFPRYKYTVDRVECLIQRGHSLQSDVFFEQTFGNVRIVFVCNCGGSEREHFIKSAIDPIKTLDKSAKHGDGSTLEPTVNVVHTKCYRHRCNVKWHSSKLVLLTDDNTRAIIEFKEAHKSSTIVVTKADDIIKNANLLLERYACGKLRNMVDKMTTEHKCTNVLQDRKVPAPSQIQRQVPSKSALITPQKKYSVSDFDDQKIKHNGLQSIKRKASDFQRGSLRSGKRFRPSENTETDRRSKMEIFLLDVMALFDRSDVPKDEWPRIEYPKTKCLNRKIVSRLCTIDSSVIGCGYQHHFLEIFFNRDADATLDDTIIQTLKGKQILNYHFNYGPFTYRPLAGINVGTKLAGRNERTGTLGGFAMNGRDSYALVSRHFAEEQENGCIYYRHDNGYSECIAVKTYPALQERGELDIAAVRILPKVDIEDMRFKTSTDQPSNTLLFSFQGQHDRQIQRLLQGELIFAWTANSSASPSIGRITVPLFERPNCNYKYVVIVNDDQAQRPREETFGKPGDSGAIVCSDDKDGNGVHVISMFMGLLQGRDVTQFLTLPLQQGLQQINRELGLNLQLS